jgi:NADPH2:quinone reductase
MGQTMKSVFVYGNPLRAELRDVLIPTPGPNEVLIKVVCCGANPKDWKMPEELERGMVINQGQDMSGYVEAVGENVLEFRKGDRVAAAHPLNGPCKYLRANNVPQPINVKLKTGHTQSTQHHR